MTRKILAFILKYLSQWAIKKHEMKLVVVAGTHGTKITGELLGEVLQPEYVVRKQLEAPFWDFSIPLAILGAEDREYRILEWLGVIFRSTVFLIFGSKNFTWTILQMNTYKKAIAMYWMDILEPEISIFVNMGEKFRYLDKLLIDKTKSRVIVSSDASIINDLKINAKSKLFTIGKSNNPNIKVKEISEKPNGILIQVEYRERSGKSKTYEYFSFQTGEFMNHPLLMCLATLVDLGFSREEIKDKLLAAEVNLERFIFKVL